MITKIEGSMKLLCSLIKIIIIIIFIIAVGSVMHTICFVYLHMQTVEFARQYYACDDIQGVYLENEGGSGTARLGKILQLHDRANS